MPKSPLDAFLAALEIHKFNVAHWLLDTYGRKREMLDAVFHEEEYFFGRPILPLEAWNMKVANFCWCWVRGLSFRYLVSEVSSS
jgi:hypothetical protein